MNTQKSLLKLSVTALLFGAVAVRAATDTWTGNNSVNWSDPANWSPSRPNAGDTLIFDSASAYGTTLNNDIVGQTLGGITFTPTGSQFALGGNSVTLDTALVVNSNTVVQTLNFPAVLNNAVTFNTVSNAGSGLSGDITVAGAVSGGGSLIKTGGGTLILNNESFSGSTVISNGMLQSENDNGNYTLSGGSFLADYGSYYSTPRIAFTADASVGTTARGYDRYDYLGQIGSPGFKWIVTGSGRWQMSAGYTNQFDGSAIEITSGATLDDKAVVTGLGGPSVPIVVDYGGTLGKYNGSGTNTLMPAPDSAVPNPITLNGPGVNNGGALDAGFQGYQNPPSNSFAATFTNVITLASDSSIGVHWGTMVLAGNIVGPGNLTKVGPNPLILSGNNSYGNTTVGTSGTTGNGGTLQLDSSSAIPAGSTLTLNANSTLDLHGNAASVGAFSDDGSGQAILDNSSASPAMLAIRSSGYFTGNIQNSGGGPLSIVISGSTYLDGVNRYTGDTMVEGCSLDINMPDGNATGGLFLATNNASVILHAKTSAASLQASGVTLGGSSADTTSLTIDLNSFGNLGHPVINATHGTGVLTANGTINVTIQNPANIIVGSIQLIKYNSLVGNNASFVLNTIPGGIVASIVTNTVNNSIDLQITSAPITTWTAAVNTNWDFVTTNWIVAGTRTLYSDGSSILFDDTASNRVVNLTATLSPGSVLVNTTNTYLFTGVGPLAGGLLTKNGSGTLIMDVSSNTYSSTTISAGTLQVGNNDGAGDLGAGTVADEGKLSFYSTNDLIFANNIIGIGRVVQNGSNTVTLGSANTYSGGTVINQGVVKLGNAAALGAPAAGVNMATVASGGALDVDGKLVAANSATVISGTGFNNSGALYNDGGGTCIGCGDVGINNVILTTDAVIGSANDWVIGASGVGISGNGHNLTKIGNGALYLRATPGTAFNQFVIGAGGIMIENPNPFGTGTTVVLTNNAYLDDWANNAGHLSWTIPNNIIIANGGGTIQTTHGSWWTTPDYMTYSGAITLNDTLTVNNSSIFSSSLGQLTFAGPISGSGSLKNTGSYLVTLSGANTYTGNTTIAAGTLAISSISQGGGAYTNMDGATLDVPSQTGYPTVSMSALALGSTNGSTLSLSRVTALSATQAPITATNLVLTGTNGIIVPPVAFTGTAGEYPLIKYTTVSGAGAVVLGGSVRGLPGYVTNDTAKSEIALMIPGGTPVIWTGTGGNNNWDIATTLNWKTNGVTTDYEQSGSIGDAVTFDDSSSVTNVNIAAAVSPALVVVSNAVNTYTFTNGSIAGTGGLLKEGSGILTLNQPNSFTGGTIVNGGTLALGYNQNEPNGTLAAGSTVNVNSGGTLLLGVEDVVGYNGGSLSQININGGVVTTAYSPNSWPVQWGGTSYRVTMPLINFTGGMLSSGAGNNGDAYGGCYLMSSLNTYASATTAVINANTVSIQNSPVFNVAAGSTPSGVDLSISSILQNWGGNIGLTKTGNGVMMLSGANTYSGATVISAGTLGLAGSGSIASSPAIIVGGGTTFDVSGLSSPFVLGSGQQLSNSTSSAVFKGSAIITNGTVALNYAAGTPSFVLTNGTLTLSSNTVFRINNTGSQLAVGNYPVISTASGGMVAGAVNANALMIGGGGAADTATLAIVGGQLNLVVGNPVNTTPTSIVPIVSGSQLTLQWPQDHTGWTLESNSISLSNPNDWFPVPGSTTTNKIIITVNPAQPNVFYRIKY